LRQFDKERQKEEDDYIQRRVNLQGEISVHTSATEIVNFVTGQKMFLSIPQMSIYERVKVRRMHFIQRKTILVICLFEVIIS
jgi:hypothetical protein